VTTTHADYGPLDDDYDETEILPIRRRSRLPLLTVLLALAFTATAAFLGGVEIQRHYGGSSSSSSSATATGGGRAFGSGRARRAGAAAGAAFGAGGFSGAGAFGGGATVGLVTLIKGTTLYVTDFTGNTVKIATAGAQVSKTVATNLRGIHPGDSVIVRGSKLKNGNYRASSISINNNGGNAAGASTSAGGTGSTGGG
jgi:hypothetical protein